MKLFNLEHNMDFMPDSEAEEYFVKEIIPKCKDKHAVQLGSLFGRDFNRYVISHKDYVANKKLISNITGNKSNYIWAYALGGIALIGLAGYAGYKLGGKGKMLIPKGNFTMTSWPSGSCNDLNIPDGFETAIIKDLWKDSDEGVVMIADDIPIPCLGEFGKELKEKIPELKDMDFAHVAPIEFTKFNIDG